LSSHHTASQSDFYAVQRNERLYQDLPAIRSGRARIGVKDFDRSSNYGCRSSAQRGKGSTGAVDVRPLIRILRLRLPIPLLPCLRAWRNCCCNRLSTPHRLGPGRERNFPAPAAPPIPDHSDSAFCACGAIPVVPAIRRVDAAAIRQVYLAHSKTDRLRDLPIRPPAAAPADVKIAAITAPPVPRSRLRLRRRCNFLRQRSIPISADPANRPGSRVSFSRAILVNSNSVVDPKFLTGRDAPPAPPSSFSADPALKRYVAACSARHRFRARRYLPEARPSAPNGPATRIF
jgi:hypothetical protein